MKQAFKLSAALLASVLVLSSIPVSAAEGDPAVTMLATFRFDADGIHATGENYTVTDNIVTITASGAYEFSGTLADGQICVSVPDESGDTGTVKLFLNGVDITGVSEAPLYVENAKNTSLNLMDGTENFFRDGGQYTNTLAVIYAKDDITIKAGGDEGSGKLTVEASYQHGIHCNNDVKVTGGILKVRSNEGDGETTGISDGIRGKTSVEIKGGKVDVNAGGDGIKSTKGIVTISGGETEVKAAKDAVQGETGLSITGGTLKANGDRGLRLDDGTIEITGGVVLATATDYQVNYPENHTVISATQATVLWSLTEEQVKDQEILITDNETQAKIYSFTPDKKFRYILLSGEALQDEESYYLTIGGKPLMPSDTTEEKIDGMIAELTDLIVVENTISCDIDGNGKEELQDLVLLAKIINEDTAVKEIVTDAMLQAADVDKDGTLTIMDLRAALQKMAN